VEALLFSLDTDERRTELSNGVLFLAIITPSCVHVFADERAQASKCSGVWGVSGQVGWKARNGATSLLDFRRGVPWPSLVQLGLGHENSVWVDVLISGTISTVGRVRTPLAGNWQKKDRAHLNRSLLRSYAPTRPTGNGHEA
jgi:hypothetical protein